MSHLPNPTECEQIAAKLIDDRPRDHAGSYHLCYFAGTLECRPANHTKDEHVILYYIMHHQLTDGFTCFNWYLLGVKINKFLEGLAKCKQPPKQSPLKNNPSFFQNCSRPTPARQQPVAGSETTPPP